MRALEQRAPEQQVARLMRAMVMPSTLGKLAPGALETASGRLMPAILPPGTPEQRAAD